MKISDINSHATAITGLPTKEERHAEVGTGRPSFADSLQRKEESDLKTRLNKLMSEINKQGEQLGKNMDIKELKQYKKLVAEFMDEVVNGSLKYSKHSQFDRRGRHKVYALVNKVNSKVEELSREFLVEERDNIKVLESIGIIKGLLLDMYI